MSKAKTQSDQKIREVPSAPWNTVLEHDPVVVGNPQGTHVFLVAMSGDDRKSIDPKYVRANHRFEAIEIYRGDGIVATKNNIVATDVTDTYKAVTA